MDFVKTGMIAHKYLADGCEFKKVKESYKLISTQNHKYEPFVGKALSESIWDLISKSTITSGERYNEFYGLLLDHFKSGHSIFGKNANILLKKGEEVVFQSPNNIVLKEPKSIRVTNSVRAGSSHSHGKRSYGVGTSKSVGESKEVIKVIDSGQIIITNKRFIYSGSKRNVDVNISQITGITPYADAIKLQRKSKQKPEYFLNLDSYAFNYSFNNETYFFFMNGQIIKSLIEGGLNKTPQVSKLQKLSAQKQIENKAETVKVNFDDFSLEYNSNWKKVENKKESHILTLERTNGVYKAKLHISASDVPQDFEKFEDDVKNLIKDKEFALTCFEKRSVNGIEKLYVSSMKEVNNNAIELDVCYFNNLKHQFGIYLTNNQSNTIAKNEYDVIVDSIKLKTQAEESDFKMNFCPNCGTQINHDGSFCQNCGFKLN